MEYLHIDEPTVSVTNSKNFWTREVRLEWAACPFIVEGSEPQRLTSSPFQQLSYLSLAKQSLDDLFKSGLSFQVKIHIVWCVDIPSRSEYDVAYPMSFVPLSISPLSLSGGGAAYGMGTFIKTVAAMLRHKMEYAENLPSGVIFKSIKMLRLLTIPESSLQAMAPVGQPIPLGMKYVDLPPELKNKRACVNIKNTDEQCFKYSMVCWKMRFYEQPNPERWPAKYAVETSNAAAGRPRKNQNLTFIDAGLNFSMLPATRAPTHEELTAFEEVNRVGVYLFDWHESTVGSVTTCWPRPIRRPGAIYSEEVRMLLHRGHFCLITNFQAFVGRQGKSTSKVTAAKNDGAHTCHRCMHNFGNDGNLQKHLAAAKCFKMLGDTACTPTRLPALCGKNRDQIPTVRFTAHQKRVPQPLVIYADFETFFSPRSQQDSAKTVKIGCNDRVASSAYFAVGSDGYEVPRRDALKLYRGEDVAEHLVLDLLTVVSRYHKALRCPEPIRMTTEEEHQHQHAARCYVCRRSFSERHPKVHDHNHFTGAYRGAACDGCNKTLKCPKVVPVYFHNLKGYDGHLIIKAIQKLVNERGPWLTSLSSSAQACDLDEAEDAPSELNSELLQWMAVEGKEKYMLENSARRVEVWGIAMQHIRQHPHILTKDTNWKTVKGVGPVIGAILTGAPWDTFEVAVAGAPSCVPGTKFRFEVLAKTSEAYPMIRFGPLKFMDTANFLKSSLDTLIESQRGTHDILQQAFPRMASFHPKASDATLELLLRKIPMPFSSMRDSTCFFQPALMPREAYDNDLSGVACDFKKYAEVQHVISTLGLQTFGEYHDVYLFTDVLALADCFESFRSVFMSEHGLDVAHFISMPSASMAAMLLRTGSQVQLITEQNGGWDLMNDVNNNIRGGPSVVFQPCSKANNPDCNDFDPNLPTSWISYVDVNSLYPTIMTMSLPDSGYSSVELPDGESERLDFVHKLLSSYTNEDLYGYMVVCDFDVPPETHDLLDFAPIAKRSTQLEELSELQRERMGLFGAVAGQEKLMPHLGKQEEVGNHIALLKLYVEVLGIKLLKIHRVWRWHQSAWMGKFISEVSTKRAQSRDKSVKETLKLTMNSLYGMMLQNKERYSNVQIYGAEGGFIKAAANEYMNDWDIFDIGDEGFLGIVKTAKPKGIVLDTPRLVGFSILELAKWYMYRGHYQHFKPKYGPRLRLLMMDTDSFIYQIQTEDVIADMVEDNASQSDVVRFDLSTRFECVNKGKLGYFKYEAGSDCITEYAGLQSKMYSILYASGSAEKKGKGIPGSALKRLEFEAFKKQLEDPSPNHVQFRRIQSRRHIIEHVEQTKKGLTSFNDKVFQVDSVTSLPLGHWRCKL